MKKLLMTSVLSTGLVLGTMQPVAAASYYTSHDAYVHHKHMKTLKRVGIGTVGGAVVGGLVGGGVGAGIGAAAGAGAGALYDRSRQHHHHDYNHYYNH
jgi:uncharacterized protein YcfJ